MLFHNQAMHSIIYHQVYMNCSYNNQLATSIYHSSSINKCVLYYNNYFTFSNLAQLQIKFKGFFVTFDLFFLNNMQTPNLTICKQLQFIPKPYVFCKLCPRGNFKFNCCAVLTQGTGYVFINGSKGIPEMSSVIAIASSICGFAQPSPFITVARHLPTLPLFPHS